MNTISITNLKGGVGKTVTSIHLGAALAHRDRQTLLIDLDLQHFLTNYFQVDVRAMPTIVDVLLHDTPVQDAIAEVRPNLFIVPSTPRMEIVDRELPHLPGGDLRLKAALKKMTDFDYCLIDCPSGWGATVRNALVASHGYILPINSETPALDSGLETERKVCGLENYYESVASLFGVLITMARRTNNAESVALLAQEKWPRQIFQTPIRRAERMNELATFSQTIYDAPVSRAGTAREDYDNLVVEVIQRCEGRKPRPPRKAKTSS